MRRLVAVLALVLVALLVPHATDAALTVKTPVAVYRVSVDASQIPLPGNRRDLLTLPVGTSVLGWWVDPDTLVMWDVDTGMGQGPEWAAYDLSHQPNYYLIPGFLGEPAHGDDLWAYDAEGNSSGTSGYVRNNRSGQRSRSALLHVSAPGPIQIANIGDGYPNPGGHLDIEFLVALPVAP